MASTRKSLWFYALVLGVLPAHAFATSGKYKITMAEKAACIGDATRLCADTYPNEDLLLRCMRMNHDALSATCRVAFDAGIKRRHL